MLGRVLFAFVWLIIGAGVALPLYPAGDVVTAVVPAASSPVQPVAASQAFGCEDYPVAETGADCPCDQVLPAVFVPLEQEMGVTLGVSGQTPAKLPAKLPAI